MEIDWLREALIELAALPAREQTAISRAVDKLRLDGAQLGSPHTSAVLGASEAVRELRPRAGRSPWRVFYRRVGSQLVMASIGPEAQVDSRGFRSAVEIAIKRLREREG